jgi:hypothetical protein
MLDQKKPEQEEGGQEDVAWSDGRVLVVRLKFELFGCR